jgi:hypothetical protein
MFLDIAVWCTLLSIIYTYFFLQVESSNILLSKPLVYPSSTILLIGGFYLFLPLFTHYQLEKEKLVWKSCKIPMKKLLYKDIKEIKLREKPWKSSVPMVVGITVEKDIKSYLMTGRRKNIYLKPLNPEKFVEELERLSKPYRGKV